MLAEIEEFMKRHELPPTRFGRMYAKDPRFVLDLRNGRKLRSANAQRLKAWMAGFDTAAALYLRGSE